MTMIASHKMANPNIIHEVIDVRPSAHFQIPVF